MQVSPEFRLRPWLSVVKLQDVVTERERVAGSRLRPSLSVLDLHRDRVLAEVLSPEFRLRPSLSAPQGSPSNP